MRSRSSTIIAISIVIVAFFTANFLMNFYHYGEYLKIDDGHIWHCSSDDKRQFCDNMSIRMMEYLGLLQDREYSHDQLEEIEGYAIDHGGKVKHLLFADVCTDPMKIILLTHSNIASPDEEFVIEDVELPFGTNSENFERCALETSFTKERSNMVTMENPEPFPAKCKSGPAPKGGNWIYDEETCKWIEREWYEGDQFEKIIQYCTDPESNTTGETSSVSKGGEIKLDSKNCTWLHGGFYNQAWVNQTSDPVTLIQNGNVISPEGNVIRQIK